MDAYGGLAVSCSCEERQSVLCMNLCGSMYTLKSSKQRIKSEEGIVYLYVYLWYLHIGNLETDSEVCSILSLQSMSRTTVTHRHFSLKKLTDHESFTTNISKNARLQTHETNKSM
jgi:hypothetical protein